MTERSGATPPKGFQEWYDNIGPTIPHGHVALITKFLISVGATLNRAVLRRSQGR